MQQIVFILLVLFSVQNFDSEPTIKLALLKYSGGGDWYANPTALPNLSYFCNQELDTNIDPNYATVDVGSAELFNYPFVHMTGHGNVVFSDAEARNLRNYLIGGGFLHIDDNYGMDPFIRVALKKVFPEYTLIELPFSHPIYHQAFSFDNGLPKIHKHDDGPAQGFGIIHEGRLICFYSYESDLGDGWEDKEVHKDPDEIRLRALRMGANIVKYAFSIE
ncbi:MAG: DUF4159 domain-containing protein [Saprospiraceae bacterium]|nr:DUF4159 domain-containing protein [Saprospiraceae bacterium]